MTKEEFLEARSNDKYLLPRKTRDECEIRLFLREVNFHCPLCGKELQYQKQKKPAAKLFEIAHIFPNSPTKQQYEELFGEERLGENSESFENRIALCKDCHETQDYHTTKEDYKKLLNKKRELLRATALHDVTQTLGLETEIEIIINKVSCISDVGINGINYKPVPLANKFYENELSLKVKVAGYVNCYYTYIRELFRNIDGKNGFVFSVLCKQIKSCFEKMEAVTQDKSEIFNYMVDWLLRETQTSSREAGEIVVSFFIQNCEVFREIA